MLERKGKATSEFLDPEIHASWNRCLTLGLDPMGKPERLTKSLTEMEEIKAKNQALTRLAHVELENLYMQISGSNFAILFANQDGIILDSVCDKSFGTVADTRRLVPGNLWGETTNGTNALGSVLISQRPSTVHAGEHFFQSYSELTCVAAPVFDPGGTLVGVMDASSDCRHRQHHTHALIRMSCITIENGLFKKTLSDKIVLEMHNRPEFLGTLQVGLMAFEEDGTLLASNQMARYFFPNAQRKKGWHFDEIFKIRFNEFLALRKKNYHTQLQDTHGSSFAIIASMPTTSAPSTVFMPPQTRFHRKRDEEFPRMVISDQAMKSATNDAENALCFNAPIHIHGETGSGKEVLARHIHEVSGVRGKFIAINCANISETLAESELFGYRSGAFTGAESGGSTGLILQADGGTLFLDEIGDMPLSLQATLLRFLDNWQVRPVGGTTEKRVDINLITATNRDLAKAVSDKIFRQDLWYRINAVEVCLPPLRERSDLQEIVEAIIENFVPPLQLSDSVIEVLHRAEWPGNIRQLKNFLVRLHIKASNGQVSAEQARALLGENKKFVREGMSSSQLREQKRDIVVQAHAQLNGNISAVAKQLGISRNTVYKILDPIMLENDTIKNYDRIRQNPRCNGHQF